MDPNPIHANPSDVVALRDRADGQITNRAQTDAVTPSDQDVHSRFSVFKLCPCHGDFTSHNLIRHTVVAFECMAVGGVPRRMDFPAAIPRNGLVYKRLLCLHCCVGASS